MHIQATRYVLQAVSIDEVWWVPVWSHAFDSKSAQTPYPHRLEMCRRAIQELGPRVRISEVERELGGTNRSIDTVEYLQKTLPNMDFRMVIGTDVLHERHLWKEFDRLIELAPPILLGREDYPCPEGFEASPPFPNVSSTAIRNAIKAGDSPVDAIPLAVEHYIRSEGLYQGEQNS